MTRHLYQVLQLDFAPSPAPQIYTGLGRVAGTCRVYVPCASPPFPLVMWPPAETGTVAGLVPYLPIGCHFGKPTAQGPLSHESSTPCWCSAHEVLHLP